MDLDRQTLWHATILEALRPSRDGSEAPLITLWETGDIVDVLEAWENSGKA